MSEGYDVRLASALKEEGYDYTGMARLIKAGELIRVRHGAYAMTPADDALMGHRRLIVATLPRCGDVCLSHASAAVLLCLPTWTADLDRVHAIKWRGGHGRRGRNLPIHTAALDGDEIVRIGGVPVTSLARTVVDCASTYPYEKAVPIGDAALRAGLLREELERALRRARN